MVSKLTPPYFPRLHQRNDNTYEHVHVRDKYVINTFVLTLKNKAKQNLVTPCKTCYFLSWKFPMNQFFLLKLHDKAHLIVLKTSCFVWIRAVSEPIRHANVVVTCRPSQALSCLLVLLLPTIQFCRPDDPSLDHKLANSSSRAISVQKAMVCHGFSCC